MKRRILFVMVASWTSAAWGEEPAKKENATEALDLLKKTAAALVEAKTVLYKADYKGTGWLESRVSPVEGTVTMGEQSQHKINSFFCDISIKVGGSEEPVALKAGSDGEQYFLVDPKTKMCHHDLDAAVQGTHARDIGRVLLREFSEPEPYADPIKSGDVEMVGPVKVAGEECIEIRIRPSDRPPQVIAVARSDYLPRRVTSLIKNDRGEATTVLTINDLVVNPKFVLSPFKLHCPEGFTTSDEFAP